MKTLVFEQWQGGHYFNYLECLVPKLASISNEVVVAITGTAAASPLFARQLGHLPALPNVRFDLNPTIPRGDTALAVRFDIVRNLVEAIERNEPDFVFVPSADEHLLALPIKSIFGARRRLREVSVEAVVHYKSYTARANPRERVVSAVQSQLLKSGVFSQLNFVNCLQYEDAVARRLPFAHMARAAGDPVPQPPKIDRRLARQALGLDVEGRWIGMIGGLDERKAVAATLAAFKAAKLGKGDRLLLAGKMVPAYSQLVEAEYADLVRDGSLVVMDRFLSDAELANCFAALNLHCSVYQEFSGLSSLMLKSVAAGVPVLVNDRPGWTRAIVRRFGTGDEVDPSNVEDFARGMRAALDRSDPYTETPAIARLLQFHSIDNFTEGVTERVSRQAGRVGSAPVLQWSWVLDALSPERRMLV
jgi:glycosyltransferase involved in cell wall biosynthesis